MIRIGMLDVERCSMCEVEAREVAAMEFYLLSFYTLSDYESGKSSKPRGSVATENYNANQV